MVQAIGIDVLTGEANDAMQMSGDLATAEKIHKDVMEAINIWNYKDSHTLTKGGIYQNLGVIARSKRQFKQAIEYLSQARKIFQQQNNSAGLRTMFI